jgi:predicted unusual protein kinase regulating ubiquinone biosynthesis (AarF/ABC1/UbiB family)
VAKRDDGIPTGRVRRTAKVGGLVGKQAARAYATRAASVGRSDDARQAARERRQIDAAEQIVEVLGQMKGAAMKVGQVASFIDLSGLPPDARERFQAKLATLRDSAPRVGFAQMRRVIEEDLDAPLEEIFDDFEQEAVAAASIGQVYRARLADGRRVAVKVQYPRVAAAVRADLQNLGLLLRAAKRIAPGLDPKAVAAEVRERLTEELDYEHEAQAQRAFARRYRGHPFVLVPRVVTELSRERVLVSGWVDGTGFEQVKQLPEAARNRFAEIVFRFFFGSLYRDGHFSGDPHPGNYLLLDDGRVAFLDFGMTKTISRSRLDTEVAVIRAGLEGRGDEVHARLVDLGFFTADDDAVDYASLLAYFQSLQEWYAHDRDFTITGPYVARLMTAGAPGTPGWELTKRAKLPPDALFARRMEGLTLGVLGQLEATGNWHRIMSEWLYGGEPSSPLGEQESDFFGRRRLARRAA